MNTNACQQGKGGYNGRVLTGVSVQTTTRNQGCILIFNSLFMQNKKRLYAVVRETLRYKSILQFVVDQTLLLKREQKAISSNYLALVLLYDYLIGKGFHKAPKKLKVRTFTVSHDQYTR